MRSSLEARLYFLVAVATQSEEAPVDAAAATAATVKQKGKTRSIQVARFLCRAVGTTNASAAASTAAVAAAVVGSTVASRTEAVKVRTIDIPGIGKFNSTSFFPFFNQSSLMQRCRRRTYPKRFEACSSSGQSPQTLWYLCGNIPNLEQWLGANVYLVTRAREAIHELYLR